MQRGSRGAWGIAAVIAAVIGAAAPAQTQVAIAPPPDGLYEAWSPLTMSPVGPITVAPPAPEQWIDVRSRAGATLVTFEPERRVTWQIRWGPHGPTEKRIDVDGATFATSRFEYDAAGHLARKIASGPGIAGGPWTWDYTTDALGRVLTRTRTLPPGTPYTRWGGSRVPLREEQRVRWRADGAAVVVTVLDGRELRRDRRDARGLLRETRFTAHLGPQVRIPFALRYQRDASGRLLAISRTSGGRVSPAAPGQRDPGVASEAIAAMTALPIERHEVHLLLGAAAGVTEEGRGVARRSTEDYSGDGCWTNSPNALQYDATGVIVSSITQCICGFCVAADEEVSALGSEIDAIDLHWTRGPWARIDGELDLTIEHRVITPRGPVAAGELRAGDAVIASDGSVRVLRSVELLPEGEARLGRNLRTRSGTFAAGGLLLESEPLRACEPGATVVR